jgi:hypothetical protein
MSEIVELTANFSRLMRVKLMLRGRVSIGMKTRPGWNGHLEHFIIRCPIHKILFEDYPHGWDDHFHCPECVKDSLNFIDEHSRRFS